MLPPCVYLVVNRFFFFVLECVVVLLAGCLRFSMQSGIFKALTLLGNGTFQLTDRCGIAQ